MAEKTFVEQRDELIAQRDELIKDNAGNVEYVEMIKSKAVFPTKLVVLIVAALILVSIGATFAVSTLFEGASPMLMWLTVGLPAVIAIVVVLVFANKSEKYDNIYRTLNRDVSAIENKIHLLGRDIDALQARIDEE